LPEPDGRVMASILTPQPRVLTDGRLLTWTLEEWLNGQSQPEGGALRKDYKLDGKTIDEPHAEALLR
jgi:hypothetical protein